MNKPYTLTGKWKHQQVSVGFFRTNTKVVLMVEACYPDRGMDFNGMPERIGYIGWQEATMEDVVELTRLQLL